MYIIKTYEGFNDLRFGMSSKEIEEILKQPPRKFYKNKDDKHATDAYDDFFVYYDPKGKCEAVEFNNGAELFLDTVSLFQKNYHEIEQMIKQMDAQIEVDELGFTSNKLGIGIYAPFKHDVNAAIESIIVFKRGYYSGLV